MDEFSKTSNCHLTSSLTFFLSLTSMKYNRNLLFAKLSFFFLRVLFHWWCCRVRLYGKRRQFLNTWARNPTINFFYSLLFRLYSRNSININEKKIDKVKLEEATRDEKENKLWHFSHLACTNIKQKTKRV